MIFHIWSFLFPRRLSSVLTSFKGTEMATAVMTFNSCSCLGFPHSPPLLPHQVALSLRTWPDSLVIWFPHQRTPEELAAAHSIKCAVIESRLGSFLSHYTDQKESRRSRRALADQYFQRRPAKNIKRYFLYWSEKLMESCRGRGPHGGFR